MRAAGRTDAETAALLSDATGLPIDEDALRRHYAPPERRAGSGSENG